MIKPEISEIASFLNNALEADPIAILALFSHRVPCNHAMIKHPTIQVGLADGVETLSILGLLNGYCGVYDSGPKKGWGALTAIYDDGALIGFKVAPDR